MVISVSFPRSWTLFSAVGIGLVLDFRASREQFVERLSLIEKKAVFQHPGIVLFESRPPFAGGCQLQPSAHASFIVNRRSVGRFLGEKHRFVLRHRLGQVAIRDCAVGDADIVKTNDIVPVA